MGPVVGDVVKAGRAETPVGRAGGGITMVVVVGVDVVVLVDVEVEVLVDVDFDDELEDVVVVSPGASGS